MTQDRDMTFPAIRDRLNTIADEVSAEGISLDDALSLYDEAVKLALKACDLAEEDLQNGFEDTPSGASGDAADGGAAATGTATANTAAANAASAAGHSDGSQLR